LNLTQKIISQHLVSGKMDGGEEIAIKVDQTLMQDATGTMVCLQFEAMEISRVRTECSVIYVDHNTLQTGFENADDHRFLYDMAAKIGAFYSRAGNGICHQLHLERFGIPGKTLLGADSHTSTAGSLGMLAIGAGGLDVAAAMGGAPFYLTMPKVINICLNGKPAPWVSAKDIILEVLRRLTVKGGLKTVLEYSGNGIQHLTIPERATITNMGAETGATSSIFPSDDITKAFFAAQGREELWQPLSADADAEYDEVIQIDLGALQPLVACPHSPDNVKKVEEIEGLKIDQVVIGSCTNSSYLDLKKVAEILKGKRINPDVSLVVAPGSRQVLIKLANEGALADMLAAGARILECACGPCVGMGQSPNSNGISLRTINRNFKGRTGTADANVYLVSPETAAASAIEGKLTDPRKLGKAIEIKQPELFVIDDSMIIQPAEEVNKMEIRRGPNIKMLPRKEKLQEEISGVVLIKLEDNITTDHIMPAGAKVLPLRSNIPAMAEHVFEPIDPDFPAKAKKAGGGLIVAGVNYGQGSSREHAALAPMYLGISAVLAKSIARIHHDNLINFGIVPMIFADQDDYRYLERGHQLLIRNLKKGIKEGEKTIKVENLTTRRNIIMNVILTVRQREILLAGGKLNWIKHNTK